MDDLQPVGIPSDDLWSELITQTRDQLIAGVYVMAAKLQALQQEADTLRQTIEGMAARIVAQSDLLTKCAEKKQ